MITLLWVGERLRVFVNGLQHVLKIVQLFLERIQYVQLFEQLKMQQTAIAYQFFS